MKGGRGETFVQWSDGSNGSGLDRVGVMGLQ